MRRRAINLQVVINAKRNKQTAVIESEGMRDQMQRVAQGEMQAMLSKCECPCNKYSSASAADDSSWNSPR